MVVSVCRVSQRNMYSTRLASSVKAKHQDAHFFVRKDLGHELGHAASHVASRCSCAPRRQSETDRSL